MTADDMNAAIDNLNQIQSGLELAIAQLQDQGNAFGAAALKAKSNPMSDVIAQLQSRTLDQWSKETDQLVAAISGLNASLQIFIDNISKNIDTANSIVKAVDIADQILNKAKSLLG